MSKFLTLLAQFGPMILALNPATAMLAPIVIHAISEAQQIPGATGAEKKAHAIAIVTDGVDIAHAAGVTGFEDPALILATVGTGIDTVVGAVKVIQGAKVAVTPPTGAVG